MKGRYSITIEEKRQYITDWERGEDVDSIARTFKRHPGTISLWVRRWIELGEPGLYRAKVGSRYVIKDLNIWSDFVSKVKNKDFETTINAREWLLEQSISVHIRTVCKWIEEEKLQEYINIDENLKRAGMLDKYVEKMEHCKRHVKKKREIASINAFRHQECDTYKVIMGGAVTGRFTSGRCAAKNKGFGRSLISILKNFISKVFEGFKMKRAV